MCIQCKEMNCVFCDRYIYRSRKYNRETHEYDPYPHCLMFCRNCGKNDVLSSGKVKRLYKFDLKVLKEFTPYTRGNGTFYSLNEIHAYLEENGATAKNSWHKYKSKFDSFEFTNTSTSVVLSENELNPEIEKLLPITKNHAVGNNIKEITNDITDMNNREKKIRKLFFQKGMNYDLVPVDLSIKNLVLGIIPFESKYKVILDFFRTYQQKGSIMKLIENEESDEKKSFILQFILKKCNPSRSDALIRSIARNSGRFSRAQFDEFFLQDKVDVENSSDDDSYDSEDDSLDDEDFKLSIPKKTVTSHKYSFRKRKREIISDDDSSDQEIDIKKIKK
eukprot:gene11105-3812_t